MNPKKKIFFINFCISLGILTFLSLKRYDLLSEIVNIMNRIQVYPTMFSINYIDLIIIAFIPLWSMPIYANFDKITFQLIVLSNIINVLGLILIFAILYFIGDQFGPKLSPLMPEYVLNVPFQNYQTFSLLLGFILTFVVFYAYSYLKTKRDRKL